MNFEYAFKTCTTKMYSIIKDICTILKSEIIQPKLKDEKSFF